MRRDYGYSCVSNWPLYSLLYECPFSLQAASSRCWLLSFVSRWRLCHAHGRQMTQRCRTTLAAINRHHRRLFTPSSLSALLTDYDRHFPGCWIPGTMIPCMLVCLTMTKAEVVVYLFGGYTSFQVKMATLSILAESLN